MRASQIEHDRPAVVRTLAVTCICLSLAFGTAVGAAAGGTAADADVSYESSLDRQGDGPTYRWDSTPLRLSLSVDDVAPSSVVCLEYRRSFQNDTERIACRDPSVGENGTTSLQFERPEWPGSSPGRYVLVASIGPPDAPELRDRMVLDRVVVLAKGGDVDGDGLRNIVEYRGPTNLTNPDTDGDGLRDGAERSVYNTSPVRADTDGDGLRDGVEVMFGTDPNGQPNDSHSLLASSVSGAREDKDDAVSDSQAEPTVGWPTVPLPIPLRYVAVVVLAVLAVWKLLGVLRSALTGRVRGLRGTASSRDDDTLASTDGGDQSLPPEEEYVLELLRRRREPVQQGTIVDETGWSKAKVSRVVSQLAARGWVEKRQEGRRNVIVLKEES